MNLSRSTVLACLSLGLAPLAACSNKTAAPASTVQGSLALSSFSKAPSAIEATNEAGVKTQAAVAADGTFKLALDKNHKYHLDVVLPGGTEPVVFPRASKRLDRDFHLATGAALIDLGSVRHYDAAPAGGFAVQSSSSSSALSSGDAGTTDDVECENGKVKGSETPCADDDQKTSCDANNDGQDDQADGECVNGKDSKTGAACTDEGDDNGADGECVNGKDSKTGAACTDEGDDNGADGECVNGVDSKTGAACTDAEDSAEADSTQPMAVPDHNAPEEVAGCQDASDDGETAD